MPRFRRVLILESMFLDIAMPEEKAKIDRLYNEGNKGSAVVFMLKRIRSKWVEMIKKQKVSLPDKGNEKGNNKEKSFFHPWIY